MKVALVHDWLNNKRGGGESVLLELANLYPDADIYTLIFNPELYPELPRARVKTSYLQSMPGWIKRRQRYLLPLISTAIEQFDLSGYDVVISSSTAWAKGVITKPETLHVCYCHSPMRMVWDYWPQYIEEQHVGRFRRAAIHVLTSRIRQWDYYSSARVDRWIANSETVAERIRKFYHQNEIDVIYPGANLDQFKPLDDAKNKGDYYLNVGTLAPYKRLDLAVAACNKLGRRLVIAGDGADRERLQNLAGPTIEFRGRVTDDERRELMAGAKAFIFPGLEDFGITPVESMASGTPVIAFGRGGLTETVIDGKTGVFFDEQTPESLEAAIKKFESMKFETKDLIGRAAEFSTKSFSENIRKAVDKYWKEYVKAN